MANLLPFMEQSALFAQLNSNVSEFNTLNIPPMGPPSGANAAYSQVVKTYLCPSDPVPATLDYYNSCWGPYGNGGGAMCFPGGGTGTNITPPGQIWARSDYFPIAGIFDDLPISLGLVGPGKQYATGTKLQMAGTINDPGLPGGGATTVIGIADGSSNTLVMSETGGKPVGYNRKRQIYNSEINGKPVDGSIEPVSSAGGAWADMFIYSSLAGGKCDESGQRLGPCMINSTTNNEIYSWHTGGANGLFGDGSVRFLRDSIPAATVIVMVTKAQGEVVTGE